MGKDAMAIVDEVVNLVKENAELRDELGRSVRVDKFYNCALSTETVGVLHGVSPYLVRKYISLGLIDTHPNSSDAKILVRASTALALDFNELREKAKFAL